MSFPFLARVSFLTFPYETWRRSCSVCPMKTVFFDGVCTLCNGFVDFLLKSDRNRQLKFSSLQGSTAQKVIPKWVEGVDDFETLVFVDEEKTYIRSEAIFELIKLLGFPWNLLNVFRLLPLKFRDGLYIFVAKNRHFLFKKQKQCRIPSVRDRERFLP